MSGDDEITHISTDRFIFLTFPYKQSKNFSVRLDDCFRVVCEDLGLYVNTPNHLRCLQLMQQGLYTVYVLNEYKVLRDHFIFTFS